MLFPDPWPKTRHHKRRLINPATAARFAALLEAGGELRLATDIGEYARAMMTLLWPHPAFEWCARRAGDWRRRPADWPPTRYEAKAAREGRRSVYLSFARRSKP